MTELDLSEKEIVLDYSGGQWCAYRESADKRGVPGYGETPEFALEDMRKKERICRARISLRHEFSIIWNLVKEPCEFINDRICDNRCPFVNFPDYNCPKLALRDVMKRYSHMFYEPAEDEEDEWC